MATDAVIETIYVSLKEEGTDVWRPVRAEKISNMAFRILGIVPSDELWEFQPGQVVICEQKALSGGARLVAASLLPPNKSLNTDAPKDGAPVS